MRILERVQAAIAAGNSGAHLRAEVESLREALEAHKRAAVERERLLQAVLDAAPAAIVLLDELGTIVFSNDEARATFFDAQAPEGQNFLRLLGKVPEPLRKALLADADHIFTFESEGESETYHLAKRPLTLDGKPHNVLVVRHVTVEVSRQENVALRKAIRVIHHEFANSLAPVISLLRSARTYLAEPSASSKLDAMLAVVEERVQHLNGFLSGFAALGRLPAPRLQTVAWRGFLDELRPLLADITIVAPALAGAGWFDPAQVQQVVLNLVKNAREAGSAPADIVLEVAVAEEGGDRISVSDRGNGMSDRVLENALVPSFTTKPTGSGIGLSLCREVLDAHGGRLRIARRDGGGVVVGCWLPPRESAKPSAQRGRSKLSLSRI